jgi:hypothetical protein
MQTGGVGGRTRFSAPLLGAAVLVYWYALKSAFLAGWEYAGDVFTALQMSRSFAEGHPLLFQYAQNHLGAGHNYFILPLFLPWTWLFGARGLFVGSLALSCVALQALLRRAPGTAWRLPAVAVCSLLGPVAFWIFDEAPQGWHAEQLFLPLAVLFALDLSEGRGRAWAWAVLIALTREEGAIVAWAVQVLVMLSGAWQWRRDWPRFLKASIAWGALFVAGLAVLAARSPAPGESRLGIALQRGLSLFAHPEVHVPLGRLLLEAAAITASLAPLWLMGLRRRTLGFVPVLLLPLAAVSALGSLLYAGPSLQFYGPTWPPRLVLLWSVAAAAAVLAARAPCPDRPPAGRLPTGVVVASAVGLSLAGQLAALRWARSYDAVARAAPRSLWTADHLFAGTFSLPERQLLECLGARLPARTPVLVSQHFFAPFERQDLLNPFRPFTDYAFAPDLVVCDTRARGPGDGCRANQAALAPGLFEHLAYEGLLLSRRRAAGLDLSVCFAARPAR